MRYIPARLTRPGSQRAAPAPNDSSFISHETQVNRRRLMQSTELCPTEAPPAAARDPQIIQELFEPFERLVQIEILGRKYEVPEKNSLLRCFQFLFFDSISYGGFCWNGTCRTCEVQYRLEDERTGRCLSCSTRVVEGMTITDAAPEVGSRLG